MPCGYRRVPMTSGVAGTAIWELVKVALASVIEARAGLIVRVSIYELESYRI